jgi:hypothetical protein
MNVVGVVVLASPPRDLIRSKRHNGRRLRVLHTYRQRLLLLLGPARHGGVVDGISSTTAWCLWWRVSTDRTSPTHARWKKIDKKAKKSSQTRQENIIYQTTGDSGGWSKLHTTHWSSSLLYGSLLGAKEKFSENLPDTQHRWPPPSIDPSDRGACVHAGASCMAGPKTRPAHGQAKANAWPATLSQERSWPARPLFFLGSFSLARGRQESPVSLKDRYVGPFSMAAHLSQMACSCALCVCWRRAASVAQYSSTLILRKSFYINWLFSC